MSNLFSQFGRKTTLLLFVLALLNPLFIWGDRQGIAHADAANQGAEPAASLTLNAPLTDWEYDENANLIYAIAKTSNKLYFIDAQTLQIKKELLVGSMPSDIVRYNNELYVALSGATGIQVVDLVTQTLGSLVATTKQPDQIAVTSDNLFYTDVNGGWDNPYMQNRTSGTITKLVGNSVIDGILAVNEQSHILFVGDTGSSGSKLYAIDYLTNQVVSDDTYDGNYGFGFPYEKILFDGSDVFYGGSRLDGDNLAIIHGAYPRFGNYSYLDSQLTDVKGNYVITQQGIYDKDHYLCLVKFPYEAAKALMGMNGRVFLLEGSSYDGKTIKAYDYNLEDASLPTLGFEPGVWGSLQSNYKIDSWATDESTPYLYAVSSETNELAVINKDDFSLVDKRYIGSKPVHIALRDGKLYIALRGETYIGVLDTEEIDAEVQRILIPSNPNQVMPVGTNNIYYWGTETFTTFHVTDGVTDQRVLESDSPSLGEAMYVASDNSIYAGGDFDVYKLDATTRSTISKQRVSDYYCSGAMIVDGDNMYFCGKRMNKDDVKTVLGTYPEQVLRAYDELVFTAKNIYDRDTYVKKLALPFTLTNAYVAEDGALYLSTANQLYKFAGVDGIEAYITASFTPKNVTFIDLGDTPGQIYGKLMFQPADDASYVQGYEAYFLDSAGNKLTPIHAYPEQVFDDGYMSYSVSTTDVPAQAKYIGVYARLSYDWVSTTPPAKTLLWDVPEYFVHTFTFDDRDADPAKIRGTVSFTPGKEYAGTVYRLYFFGEDGIIGEPLTQWAGGKQTYSSALPETELPADALGLALLEESEGYEAPVYQYLIFDDFITPDIKVSDIVLTKYRVQSDTVLVKQVAAGDVINVYREDGALIGTGKVPAGQSTILISLGNMGSPGQHLIVTRTMANKFESNGTLVTIPAIVEDGGGGGGGGGGGIIIPPFFPNPGSTDDGLEAKNDKGVAVVDVSSDHIADQLKDDAFKNTNTVVLKTASTEAEVAFQIPVDGVQQILSQSGTALIDIQTPKGSWVIDAKTLQEAIGKDKSGQSLIVTIKQSNVADTTAMKGALPGGAELLGTPMSFEAVVVGSDGKKTILESFSRYVNHKITLKADKVNVNELAGLMFDPESGKFVPVPVKFEYKDGVLTASLYRKGNSVYAIANKKVSFKDVPSTSPYGNSIKGLASKTVINGYPDGTFKPDNQVTRAEFAVMLTKSLGISAAKSAQTSKFKDVPVNSWYAAYVEAAVGSGIIAGFEDGSFKPNQTITHQEMVAMLVKAMRSVGYSETSTEDNHAAVPADVPAWASDYFAEAQQAKLINRTNDLFHYTTDAASTRKDCALLLNRLLNEILFP
ncbi:S-layer homology domain-containing protein [Paenibacillus sp. BC26]|uniref:S-layer homology domain-containing protein n=1 Tax=Paenibacillus sp. BC26 TaxID=1881032 RepID=UPI0008E700C4|nr:S-layer homology domain-containing protein [Paenibacillus sp. BC26]SFT21931.1 S-layer homology domain-containing protein [Paenibacillus sp. BC26]